jgi:hemoglobin
MSTDTIQKDSTFFQSLGGRLTIERVHRSFYDKVYADPWLKQFFRHVPQATIESQQNAFMTQAFGGPQIYCGAFPIPAHKHMYITEELFLHRHALLKAALQECLLPKAHIEKWLSIDGSFRKGIVKPSKDSCQKRHAADDILDFLNPLRTRR